MRETSSTERHMADAFKALGHPVRIAILRRVTAAEPCVSDLQTCVGQSQPSISQHLGVLRDRGLIVPERRGNRTCYRVADDRLAEVIRLMEIIVGPE